ncbi:MAG: tyrosine-protein phosphatase, partial [Bacteroidaceae bacterium]|nr:tyrosine-protein phosphatase [Bacteroidaceae bacterium]
LMPLGVRAQVTAGTYYFYNVGAGKYLNYGGSDDYTACLKPHGEPLVLAASGTGFTVQTALYSRYLSATATTENACQSSGTVFTFTQQSDGTYTISSSAGYMGFGGTVASNLAGTLVQMNLSDATSDNARWQLLTKNDLMARLNSASASNPVDATFFITCPNFDRHHAQLSAWTDYTTGNNVGYLCNNAAYKFDSNTTVQQTLSGMPNGVYLLKAQAFYRHGSNGTATGYSNPDDMPVKGVMFAGTDQVAVANILSPDQRSATDIFSAYGSYGRSYGGGYIPYGANNNYAGACIAFDNGLYTGNELQTIVTDGTLTIGFKITELTQYSWIAYDNIELYYLGAPADLTPFKEAYYALRTKIQDNIVGQTAVFTDNDGALAAYNTVLAAQNDIVENASAQEDIEGAKTALWQAALTFLESVKVNDGQYFDLTSFMVNPAVAPAPSSTTAAEGWTASKNMDFGTYQITQFPGSSSDPHFNLYQVVADMPAGQYTVKARGFFRPGAFSSSDMTSVSTTDVPVLLYLNETTQPLLNICADGSATALSKGASTVVNGTTLYVPNSRSHLQAFYDAGHYWNEMPAVVSDRGDLTIGLKYDDWVSGGWGVISDFNLYYRGALDLSAWQEQLAQAVNAAQNLVIPTQPRRQLTDVIQQNNKTYTTAEDYQTAIAAINAAVAVAEPYVEPYADYKTMRQMIQERFIDQTAVYTDEGTAASDYSSALSTANTNVENVGSVAALEAEKQNLWAAALTFLKSVTINEGQGFDLTWMIQDADFSDANYKNYWTETLASSTTIGVTSGVMRYYNSSFDLGQTLPYLLPAGAYKMTVDGFERTNDPRDTAWADYQAGNSVVTGAIYLNNNEQLVMNLFDYKSKMDDGWGGKQPSGASFYIPDGSGAANTYLQNGVYPNTLIGVLADDAEVTIGYRCANTKAWTAVDNFKLWYIGEVPQVALNNAAGELTPVCAPFTLSTDAADVEELYALAGEESDGTISIYSVSTVPAGTPCYARFSTANYSAPMEMTLSSGKKFVMPWSGGWASVNAANNSWNYYDMEGNPKPVSHLSTKVLDFNQMEFTVNLENLAARRYLNLVTYNGSSDASEVAAYNVAPPTRRDIPNAVMIPLPAHHGEMEVTVENNKLDEVANITVPAGVTEAYVYNLVPQEHYFFNTNTDYEGEFQTTGRLRMVYAPSAYNIRDLGGWETQDGYRTTYGHLFRGSTLNGYVSATAEDLQTLRDLGVGGEIDLRYQETYDKDMGCGTSAFGFGTDDYFFAAANDWTAANLNESGTQQRLKQEFDFILDHFRQGKAVYYHCAWGADRTGMLTFLLEGVLGLTIDQIYKDYELTSFSAAPGATNRLKSSFQDRIDVILALDGATLRDKFENYFLNKLGVSATDITYFRSVMLEVYPLTVDEDAAMPTIYDGEADILLHRTLKAGMHNTVVLPCNLPLWKAQQHFGSDVKMERITAYDDVLETQEIDEAPAHTPFLLTPSAVSADHTYLLNKVKVVEGTLQDAEFTNGKLVGVYDATLRLEKSTETGKDFYVISNDRFYRVNADPAPLRNTRAYLVLDTPAGQEAKAVVRFSDDETTGIGDVNSEQLKVNNDAAVFDLQGRRVAQPAKGLYIVGGKKVLMK